jgi:hypothetical protein
VFVCPAVVKFQATGAYSSSDLTKTNNSIYEISAVEKENIVWQINTSPVILWLMKERKSI